MNSGQWGKAGQDDPGAGLNMKGKQEAFGIPRESRYTKMEMYQLRQFAYSLIRCTGGVQVDRPN